jgi:glucose/arabinose dehydrogenase
MIELSRENFAIAENGGTVNLIVNRSGNINVATSVDYATANGTALAGQDYVTKAGTINFAVGETTKNITIDITNNNVTEVSETFTVVLSNAIGATLGAGTIGTVTIADDDGQPLAEQFIGGLNQPIAFKWIPGSQTMFIAEKSGIVKVANGNAVQATPFLDFRDRVNDSRDRGLMDMVLHPDFNNGKPYVYLLYVYDPAQATVKDVAVNRNARLTRVRAQQDANGVWTAVPNSEEIIVGKNSTWANIKNPNADSTDNLNLPASGVTINPNGSVTNLDDYIAVESQSHAPGSVLFGPDGKLYVTIGDGTSYNNTDPRSGRVQDVNNLSGKVLRIDPDTGEGLDDNPFWTGNQNDNASKVYALGVRNGFRAVFGPTGQLVLGDVGWNTYEEVNVVTKGANLGWPWFEGGAGVPLPTGGYKDLQEAKDFYNSGIGTEAAAYAYNHDGKSSAIMVGDFYTGTNPVWQNTVFVADLSQGWVKALTFDNNGVFQQEKDVVLGTPGNAMPYIADMNMGADGNMYYLNLAFGQIGRWVL